MRRIAKKKKKTISDFLIEFSKYRIAEQTIRNWMNGDSLPQPINRGLIANFLGVSTKDLFYDKKALIENEYNTADDDKTEENNVADEKPVETVTEYANPVNTAPITVNVVGEADTEDIRRSSFSSLLGQENKERYNNGDKETAKIPDFISEILAKKGDLRGNATVKPSIPKKEENEAKVSSDFINEEVIADVYNTKEEIRRMKEATPMPVYNNNVNPDPYKRHTETVKNMSRDEIMRLYYRENACDKLERYRKKVSRLGRKDFLDYLGYTEEYEDFLLEGEPLSVTFDMVVEMIKNITEKCNVSLAWLCNADENE